MHKYVASISIHNYESVISSFIKKFKTTCKTIILTILNSFNCLYLSKIRLIIKIVNRLNWLSCNSNRSSNRFINWIYCGRYWMSWLLIIDECLWISLLIERWLIVEIVHLHLLRCHNSRCHHMIVLMVRFKIIL